jgi:hypothetical protein
MKLKTILLASATAIIALGYTSCKKSSDNNDANSTITEANSNHSTSDASYDDANDAIMENAGIEAGGIAKGPGITANPPTCATVTVSGTTFPKTITIDFGTVGCVSGNGFFTRKGIITVVVSDSLRHPGSTATATFTNYYVNDYHIEGTVVWTNTSNLTTRSWHRSVTNGKTTNPSGSKFWIYSGDKDIVQIGGLSTPGFRGDDVFSITGNHTVTNSVGVTHTSTILTPVIRAMACKWGEQGTIKFQGPNHYAVLDFGAGTCDDQATLAIDGGTPTAITLP